MDAPLADLSVPDLARLHRRRSDKWAGYEPGVLVSTIAEMDFPLAPAVAAALHAAVDRHDLGYAPARPGGAPRRVRRASPRRRLGWQVDPEQVTLVPDVMAGLVELCRVLAGPGDAVAFATPAYPPFYTDLPPAGVRARARLPLGARTARLDLDATRRRARRGRPACWSSPVPTTRRAACRPAPSSSGSPSACAGARRLGAGGRDPRAARAAGRERTSPWLELSDAARARGIALTSASQGVQSSPGSKAALVVDRLGDRAREAVARLPDLSRPGRAARRGRRRGGVRRRRRVARRGAASSSTATARLLARPARRGAARRSAGRRPRPPTSRGSTAVRWGSARTRRPPSWRAGGSRSAAGSTTALRAPAMSGSTSERARSSSRRWSSGWPQGRSRSRWARSRS